MTNLVSYVEQIEEINRRLASGDALDPAREEQDLQRLELLREQLNQLRREAEGGIQLARQERQEALQEEAGERLA